jgi:hypothetical protein
MREYTLDAATCWELWHQWLEDQRVRYTPTEPHSLDAMVERFTIGGGCEVTALVGAARASVTETRRNAED